MHQEPRTSDTFFKPLGLVVWTGQVWTLYHYHALVQTLWWGRTTHSGFSKFGEPMELILLSKARHLGLLAFDYVHLVLPKDERDTSTG